MRVNSSSDCCRELVIDPVINACRSEGARRNKRWFLALSRPAHVEYSDRLTASSMPVDYSYERGEKACLISMKTANGLLVAFFHVDGTKGLLPSPENNPRHFNRVGSCIYIHTHCSRCLGRHVNADPDTSPLYIWYWRPWPIARSVRSHVDSKPTIRNQRGQGLRFIKKGKKI